MNQAENVQKNLIGKVQDEFKKRVSSVGNRAEENVFFAAYDYDPADISKDDDEINYTYYFGVEVTACEQVPKAFTKKVIPRGKYAVFIFDMKEGTLNGEKLDTPVYDYIDGVWLPNSGFELAETPDYEVIREAESHNEYYISIK
jgi:AraC family transcriptional regulator